MFFIVLAVIVIAVAFLTLCYNIWRDNSIVSLISILLIAALLLLLVFSATSYYL